MIFSSELTKCSLHSYNQIGVSDLSVCLIAIYLMKHNYSRWTNIFRLVKVDPVKRSRVSRVNRHGLHIGILQITKEILLKNNNIYFI